MRVRILTDLNVALPFSDDVYRQLADQPPHQHPRLCQGCGWDERTDVPDRQGGLATWSRVNDTICTRCEQQQEAA